MQCNTLREGAQILKLNILIFFWKKKKKKKNGAVGHRCACVPAGCLRGKARTDSFCGISDFSFDCHYFLWLLMSHGLPELTKCTKIFKANIMQIQTLAHMGFQLPWDVLHPWTSVCLDLLLLSHAKSLLALPSLSSIQSTLKSYNLHFWGLRCRPLAVLDPQLSLPLSGFI